MVVVNMLYKHLKCLSKRLPHHLLKLLWSNLIKYAFGIPCEVMCRLRILCKNTSQVLKHCRHVQVLKNFSLKVYSNQTVALVGSSGSGAFSYSFILKIYFLYFFDREIHCIESSTKTV
jgi:hypothetical protein